MPITHVRRIVVLLFVNLGASALFAVLTLVYSHSIVDFQLAAGSDQTRDELVESLWIRALLVLVGAAFYAWIAHRMLDGRRAAYLRVRSISVIGLLGVAYLLVTGAYPGWLRALEVFQLILLAALVVLTNLRVVREAFPRAPRAGGQPGNLKAALLLVVITPVIAEVLLGNVSVARAWLVLLYVPIYGAGALLIRELVRRSGGGLPGLLLMGLAYGLLEEGLALQSLTSPHLYNAARWGPRLFGINTTYAELNLPYHAVFSVLIPILLVELLFPGHGTRPYLRTPGVVITGFVTLLGASLLRISVPPSADPGYLIPLPAAIVIGAAIATTVFIALRSHPRPAPDHTSLVPPTPAVTAAISGSAVLIVIALLYPFAGATQSAFTTGMWVLAPMAAAAVVGVTAGVYLARCSGAPAWTDRHTLAAIAAAVIAHSLFGVAANSKTLVDQLVMAVLIILTVAGFGRLDRRLRDRRPAASTTTSPAR